jgi:alkylated DNA repair dioxygenase AlkB
MADNSRKCTALTKAGNPCKYKAKTGDRCGVHSKNEGGVVEECFTITFGEVAENHVRMQKIGIEAKEGFSCSELLRAQKVFKKEGLQAEYIDLAERLRTELKDSKEEIPEAGVLVIREGVSFFLPKDSDMDSLKKELHSFKWDTKALMYGRVRNKKARYNVCFDDQKQDPDYESGKGTVIAFSAVPNLDGIRKSLSKYLGNKAAGLKAEGNYYYDTSRCYIGWHGDSERKIVIAARIGELPLWYRWYRKGEPIGSKIKLEVHSGDVYVMSQKATGNDWKKRTMMTLRHGAGKAL